MRTILGYYMWVWWAQDILQGTQNYITLSNEYKGKLESLVVIEKIMLHRMMYTWGTRSGRRPKDDWPKAVPVMLSVSGKVFWPCSSTSSHRRKSRATISGGRAKLSISKNLFVSEWRRRTRSFGNKAD